MRVDSMQRNSWPPRKDYSMTCQSEYNRIIHEHEIHVASGMGLVPTTLKDLPVEQSGYIYYDYHIRRITRRFQGWNIFAGNSPEGQKFISCDPLTRVWIPR